MELNNLNTIGFYLRCYLSVMGGNKKKLSPFFLNNKEINLKNINYE